MERNRRGEHESLCTRLRYHGRVSHEAVDVLFRRASGTTSERPVSER
jgi:hypothetical protein